MLLTDPLPQYIEDLKNLPEPKRTLLEIMKVHNKEVSMSNLLVYFFDDKKNHGLKNVFLEALLNTNYLEVNGENKNFGDPLIKLIKNQEVGNIINVIAEQRIEGDKRIDILIETENHVICIEFKIKSFIE